MNNKGAYQGDMLLDPNQWEIVNSLENDAELGSAPINHLPDPEFGETVNEERGQTFPLPAMNNKGAYQGDMLLDPNQWEIVNSLENDAELGSAPINHLAGPEFGETVNEERGQTFPLPAMNNKGAYQGDMLLDHNQWEIVNALENDEGLGKRKAHSNLIKRWPEGRIHYFVTPKVEKALGRDIKRSVKFYKRHTCLKFTKLKGKPSSGGYILIKNGKGCSSHVGYLGEKQIMNLNISGCKYAIPHEFGHAIGFWHEQSRPDRDSYISVRWNNIIPSHKHNFDIQKMIKTYGVRYDYKSYMHYGPTGFSIDRENKPTIVTKNPLDMIDMGKSDDPNFNDIKMLNLMYKCSEHCLNKTCNNEGYQDKNCNCVCPQGWKGPDCSTSVPVADDCKNTITGGSGVITSKNYPRNYPGNHVCQWYLKGTSPGQTITVNFEAFEVPYSVTPCVYDYVQVRISDLFFGGDKYCGSSRPGLQVVKSTTSPPEMLIYFESNWDWYGDKRFKFTYSIE